VYNGIVPGLAIPWTRLLLTESEFGFMLQDPVWTAVLLEDFGIADEALDTGYGWELVDEPLDFADEVIDE
jgi:hypothetical protein